MSYHKELWHKEQRNVKGLEDQESSRWKPSFGKVFQLTLCGLNQFHGCPPPPGVCRAFVILGKKVANAPLWGPNNATKSPPLGTYIDANAPPLGDKSFLRISDPKNRMQALSRINISVFKTDSVAISFQNVFN
jgi:hypothetical protein